MVSFCARVVERGVIAINNCGEIGAASMRTANRLQYAVWINGESNVLDAAALY